MQSNLEAQNIQQDILTIRKAKKAAANKKYRDNLSEQRKTEIKIKHALYSRTYRANQNQIRRNNSNAAITEHDINVNQRANQNQIRTNNSSVSTTGLDVDTNQASSINHRWRKITQEWDDENPCMYIMNKNLYTLILFPYIFPTLISYCNRIWLKSVEKKSRFRCCFNGRAIEDEIWPKLNPLSNQIKREIFGEGAIQFVTPTGAIDTTHCPRNNIAHISRNSARYNGILSISATGVDNGKGGGWEHIRGSHAGLIILYIPFAYNLMISSRFRKVKMCGRTYHYLPRSNKTGGLHHFIVDKYSEALMHGEKLISNNKHIDSTIKNSILQTLWDTLHERNRFVQSCQILGKAVEVVNNQNPEDGYLPANELFTTEVIAQINSVNAPHLLDVASVTDDSVIGQRIIRFKLKGSNEWNNLPVTHHHLEPLTYPLLFLDGEDGWGINVSKTVHFPDYIVSRMLMPEEGIFVRNEANTKWIPANRFQLFARISQYWLCDCVSRNIDCRLTWVKRNQSYIFGRSSDYLDSSNQSSGGQNELGGEADLHEHETNSNIHNIKEALNFDEFDYNEAENNNGIQSSDQPVDKECSRKTFLGSKFHGSRRHLRTLSENGLIVVSEKGQPHLFITLTTNTEWPEIKEHLFIGQTAFDRYINK